MTIRNLAPTLAPTSIALIGASDREGSVGRVVLRNVLAGGFKGRIHPVNPKYDEVQGLACYRRVADLPDAPEIAVIMTPAPTVPKIVGDLGTIGTKVAVILSAGITSANGLRQAVLNAAAPHLLRLFGPNTIGLLAPRVALNASFTHIAPAMGRLGLISQSGAMVSSIVDWAAAEGIGFSQIYSLGDMADVDVGDCLNVLASDTETGAILMYLESIPEPRKFMSAARAAARIKPVIAVKPGRHAEAAKAAATHTGALAGADRIIDAALRRAGVIRVDDLEDLFEAAEITSRYRPLQRARVAIVTNGGGAGVLAVDKLLDDGAELAQLGAATMAALDAALPANWSRANPVDIVGDAPPERYRAAVRAVAADSDVDALLVMNCPTALADPSAAAAAVAAETRHGLIGQKPVLTCWLGKKAAEPARNLLRAAGIGDFETPAEAAEAVSLLTRWSTLRTLLQRVPPEAGHTEAFDTETARCILVQVANEKRSMLTEDEAKALLAAYGIPTPRTIIATDPEAVERAADELLSTAGAVVVKIRSRAISHKSDVGGVALNLASAQAAREAAADMSRRLAAALPQHQLDGFTVQPMIRRSGEELIVGLSTDPAFGPVVLFGAGGVGVEVDDDTVTGLVPLDTVLAGDLIDRTRISRRLAGYRDRKPADRAAITSVMVAVSQLAVDLPMIGSIDVNPLLADSQGVVALDARVEIDLARVGLTTPNPLLAIRPYPAAKTAFVELSGTRYLVRPIKPADAQLYPRFLARVSAEDMRLRFLVPTRTLSHETLLQLTQLDYDRQMAFVALEPTGDLAGIVRYAADPDRAQAEFGVLVRSDLQGRGLGQALMQKLIDYARREGIGELFGGVLRENGRMGKLCSEFGFATEETDDPQIVLVSLPLQPRRSTQEVQGAP